MKAKLHTVAELAATYDGALLVEAALAHLTRVYCGDGRPAFTAPSAAGEFAAVQLGACVAEKFCCAWLDNRHRLIAWEVLFNGSIDGASVHPREVVRAALQHNAAAVIFAHNHPSGITEPSQADRDITRQLQQALKLIEVRVLDHFIVGGGRFLSLAERGWL
jgi:DNA repair protein RadC